MIAKAHYILYVADKAKSTTFYSDVLGMEPRIDVPGMTEFDLSDSAILGLMPELGIRRLLGANLPDPAVIFAAPRCEMYLIVESPDAYHQRALAAGALELSEPSVRSWGHRAAYSLDLDGHVIAFASET